MVARNDLEADEIPDFEWAVPTPHMGDVYEDLVSGVVLYNESVSSLVVVPPDIAGSSPASHDCRGDRYPAEEG